MKLDPDVNMLLDCIAMDIESPDQVLNYLTTLGEKLELGNTDEFDTQQVIDTVKACLDNYLTNDSILDATCHLISVFTDIPEMAEAMTDHSDIVESLINLMKGYPFSMEKIPECFVRHTLS